MANQIIPNTPKVDPVIKSTIRFDEAMGITKAMTGEQVVERWTEWKGKYPDQAASLSPAIVAALNTLETIVTVQIAIRDIPPLIEKAVVTAGDAYNIALSVLPGVGAAQGGKLALEKAMGILKKTLEGVLAKLQNLPQKVYEAVTNVEVDENAIL